MISCSPDDVLQARTAYEQFCSIPNANLGPIWQFPGETIDDARKLHPLIDRFLQQAQAENCGRILHVPSPWHAFFVAMRLQHEAQRADIHLIFRGQHNSSYKLVASFDRLGAKERQRHQRAADILQEFMAQGLASIWQDMDFAFSANMAQALAQHYGIKTRLLDFTADPAVAIFFASRPPGVITCPTASVYMAPLPRAYKLGVSVVLPPPFVHRLYVQRAVFVQTESPELLLSNDEFSEIRFPINYPHGPFAIWRDAQWVDILQSDRWLRRIVFWAKLRASNNQKQRFSAAATDEELLKVIDRFGYPDYLSDPFERMRQLAEYVDQFNEMLYWLAYIIHGDQELLYAPFLDPITAANPQITNHVATLTELLGRKAQSESKLKLAAVLRESLRRSGFRAAEEDASDLGIC